MPTFPIPVFAALVLGFLFFRLWFQAERIGPLAALLGLCGVQALIIALAQHYEVPLAQLLQPLTATLIPGLAWVAFQSTAIRRPKTSDLLHALGPIAALAARLTGPVFLEVLIPALFIGYGGAIIYSALKGPDALPRLRLDTGNLPAVIWIIIGASLVASAFVDAAIVLAQIMGAGYLKPWIISLHSAISLGLIGALSLSGALQAVPDQREDEPPQATAEDGETMDQLSAYMETHRPYLDPDLTLSKLSRKLGVPAKTLSTAINRATGENVSRYINAARISAAQSALKAGEPVTTAMLSAGFNTKSNFNREFLRVAGQSPSDWLKSQAL